jgi:glutathione synthase/RimK-type ligase-like ATP-grasp enzyme
MSQASDIVTLLVLTSGDGTGLNFTRSLRRAGGYRIIGVDRSVEDFIVSEADERILVGPAEDKRLIQIIAEIASRYEADLLYAADTDSLLMLVSRRRAELGVPTMLPDYDDHLRAEDKWSTYVRLAQGGFPVPATELMQTEEELRHMLDRHQSVWLRRITGSGGAGSLATDSLDLARAWIDTHKGWGEFTAAEHLSRRTATFSGIWENGELVASQLRERTSWKYDYLSASGVTGITAGQMTLWDSSLHELAVQSVRAVLDRPHGVVGVDFTYGHDDKPYITEIQPARFYSSMEFLAAVGINLPDIYCRLALGLPLPPVDERINPVRVPFYWYKAVDMLPKILTQAEVDAIAPVV